MLCLVLGRSILHWCNFKDCFDPDVVCANFDKDLIALYEMRKRNPDKLLLIRYEDLCEDPFQVVKDLLTFLGLPPSQEVNIQKNKENNAPQKRFFCKASTCFT